MFGKENVQEQLEHIQKIVRQFRNLQRINER